MHFVHVIEFQVTILREGIVRQLKKESPMVQLEVQSWPDMIDLRTALSV